MLRCDPLSVMGGVELTPSTYGLFEGSMFDLVLENPFKDWAECTLEINGQVVGVHKLDPIERLIVATRVSGPRFSLTPEIISGGRRALVTDQDGEARIAARYSSSFREDFEVEVALVSLGPLPLESSTNEMERLAFVAEYRVWKEYTNAFHFEHDEIMMATVPFAWKARPEEDAILSLAPTDPEEVKDALKYHRDAKKRYLDRMVEGARTRVLSYLEEQTLLRQS